MAKKMYSREFKLKVVQTVELVSYGRRRCAPPVEYESLYSAKEEHPSPVVR
jgi:hypothetical protein